MEIEPTEVTSDEDAAASTADIIPQPLKEPLEIIIPCALGSRHKGSTYKKRKIAGVNLVVTINEIAIEYNIQSQRNKMKKLHMKCGSLTSLITQIKARNNIAVDVIISEETICQRIKRGNIYTNEGQGHDSPLFPLERTIVQTIIQMSRI